MTLSYSRLLDDLRQRTARSHTSLLGPHAPPLRRWLDRHLDAVADEDGLIGEPVFEHKFGFAPHDETLDALGQRGEVHPALVDQMHRPPKSFEEQHFRRDWFPYTHQVAAWRALADDTSIVVSAGTGAGKTECFAVPILSDLVGQALSHRSTLVGVQALFLYPLNALINSQRERLSAWTRGFGGRVRYCLYNGETKNRVPAHEQAAAPEQVLSRKLLRESPPPLLITNATMLEYMLVRPDDAPILDASQGKLRYIVIDEAHTYVGSMAAELALLLRRVMNAFGVSSEDVRFIATSATLSSSEAQDDVEAFLAKLAGQPRSRVRCITDRRAIPPLPDVEIRSGLPDLDALEAADEVSRFEALAAHQGPRSLRDALVSQPGQRLTHLAGRLAGDLDEPPDLPTMLKLLDLGTRARPAPGEEAFLPLRGHLFARALSGLWCCANPACPGRSGPLDDPAWRYGRLYTSRHVQCTEPGCGGRVYELTLCVQCGHEQLLAHARPDDLGDVFEPMAFDDIGVAVDERDDAEVDDEDLDLEVQPLITPDTVFFDAVEADGSDLFDPASGEVGDGSVAIRFHERVHDEREASCLRCGYRGRHDRLFARPARTGRTFLLGVATPALLQAMPPVKRHSSLPFEGRRTISFTDSRQGTARFAARSQTGAERAFVRSFVYHDLLAKAADRTAVEKAEKKVQGLETLLADGADPGIVEGMLEEARKALEVARGPSSVPLHDVARRISQTDDFKHLHRYWQTYLPFKQKGVDEDLLARWLVLGEFARRPMRAASLETLGLVQVVYQGIDTRRAPPPEWMRLAGEQAEASWADFLTLCLDFYVRSNTALDVERADDFFRWVGTRITQKTVAGPDGVAERNKRVTWPRAGFNSRLEGLLRRAFRLTATDAATKAQINDVFRAAWDRLRGSHELFQAMPNGGLAIKTTALHLRLVDEAWLCPVTGTLLATTLLGHSPYAPTNRPLDTRGVPIRMPRAPVPWGWRFEGVDAIRQALSEDETYQQARDAGAISEFTDRIFEGVVYWQTAEHSAQIPSQALKAAEWDFKRGRLNLLSCSTTMEMGVDIGNLSGVAMNNVPPSPANFLQRVGRAGRRGESASVSLTVCRHLPHDQAVFAEPDWPFRAPMHVTPVKLDSRPIVERHVRAAILTTFLARHAPEDAAYRLTCRWFLVPEVAGEPSVCERLCDWMRSDEAASTLEADLERLVRGSALQGRSTATLLEDMLHAFSGLAEEFHRVRDALLQEFAQLPEEDREDSPAAYLFRRQIARHEEEYLLSYLADQQVLPGYGFPTGVVPFIHTTMEEVAALERDQEEYRNKRRRGEPEDFEAARQRIDARARLTGLASRDLPMAIREYAPGSSLVLDRRSYRSKGVRLAWKIPPSAKQNDTKEIQALRKAWHCRACGAAGTAQVNASVDVCPGCGEAIARQIELLVPSGFTSDFFDKATMDDTGATYVPVMKPWISSGEGPFRAIGTGTPWVRFRHTSAGEIVHRSGGAHKFGYALCLRCGRAEPETAPGVPELPNAMKDHRRLRSGKPCAGALQGSFSIKRNLFLGGSTRTDVLEIWILDPVTGHPAHDETLVTTTAVALRKVSARHLGVDEREIGYATSRRQTAGHTFRAILLFDTATGGAGFVAQIPEALPRLLREVAATCRACPRDCDEVCHACLLSNDTQHDIHRLNRHALSADGVEVLGERFLDALEPDLSGGVFGAATRAVWTDPVERLLSHAQAAALDGPVMVSLYGSGPSDEWDLPGWPGRSILQRLRGLGDQVLLRLVVPAESLTELDWQRAGQLQAVCDLYGAHLFEVAEVPGWWADVRRADGTARGWATDALPVLDASWPETGGVHQSGPCDPPGGSRVVLQKLRQPPPPETRRVDLSVAASGSVREFGDRVLQAFDGGTGLLDELSTRGPAERVEVHDRYLRSPLVVRALWGTLEALKKRGVIGSATHVSLYTLEGRNERGTPRQVGHDWAFPEIHAEVIRDLLHTVHPDLELVTRRYPNELQHARAIELEWADGLVELRLDEGFGFVRTDRTPFPFTANAAQQVTTLMNARWPLVRKGPPREVPGYVVRRA